MRGLGHPSKTPPFFSSRKVDFFVRALLDEVVQVHIARPQVQSGHACVLIYRAWRSGFIDILTHLSPVLPYFKAQSDDVYRKSVRHLVLLRRVEPRPDDRFVSIMPDRIHGIRTHGVYVVSEKSVDLLQGIPFSLEDAQFKAKTVRVSFL